MKNKIASLFMVLCLGMITVGCAQTVPGKPIPQFDFLTRATVPVMVSQVVVQNDYIPPLASPNVDHLFDVTLAEATRHWADRRLNPQGSQGTLTVTIEEAGVVETPLSRTQGVRGVFMLDQAYRYTGRLIVSLAADNPNDNNPAQSSTRATVERSITVGEQASPNDRDKAWAKLTEDMMRDLDLYLTKSMKEKLPFLIDQSMIY